MRLLSFTLPNDPAPRVGVLAHDGARVVDLTAIGAGTFAEAVAKAPTIARVSAHLLHMPGAMAYPPGAVRLAAPALRLAAVYDVATGEPAPLLADRPGSPAAGRPGAPDSAVPARLGLEYGAGVAAVVGRAVDRLDPAAAAAAVAGVTLVHAWRAGGSRVDAAVVGPWLTTPDELPPHGHAPLAFAVDAAVAVNGEPLRAGSWAALTARLADALAAASHRAPLAPGDAVAVVTFELARDAGDAAPGVSFVGAAGTRPGDEVVLEADRLGALRALVAPAATAGVRSGV